MTCIHRYVELTLTELNEIEPQKTICLMTVSPIEVHGPHLPLGTDVFVGEKLQMEYCKALAKKYPDYSLIILPPLFAGCDTVPVKGSISIRARTLEKFMWDYVRGLAGQGFKYLIICDNHGGPSHQIAMEIVSRKAWRRYRFAIINPFNVVFKKMVQCDKNFLESIDLLPGKCGDDTDCHAGTNETSLMLVTNKDLVKGYEDIPANQLPARTGMGAIIGWMGSIISKIGSARIKGELEHIANLLGWVNDSTYIGSPNLASPEAGERMLKGHVAATMELVDNALSGERPYTEPMLWWMRAFRR